MNESHHGRGTRLYSIWKAMKVRCYNLNFKAYPRYGGRGITVCEEWLHDFPAFRAWAMVNGYRDDLTIDRIDNKKGYSPDNCRWATYKQQANNTRRNILITIDGETASVAEICQMRGINQHLVYDRITRLGWEPEKAINTPARKIKNRRNTA